VPGITDRAQHPLKENIMSSATEDTYKGESPSKKYARFMFWREVLGIAKKNVDKYKHLVLASREGGDISFLLGIGVRPKLITAVDINGEAALIAQEKFNIPVIRADVGKVARNHRREFGFGFLDFCQPLSNSLVEKVLEVMVHGMRDGALVGGALALLRGDDASHHPTDLVVRSAVLRMPLE
jgi:hypothetical protein